MSFESKHFESMEILPVLKTYIEEYSILKDTSPEKAREYLTRVIEGIDMHLGNEVLKEEFGAILKKTSKHDLEYLARELSAILEKDEAVA